MTTIAELGAFLTRETAGAAPSRGLTGPPANLRRLQQARRRHRRQRSRYDQNGRARLATRRRTRRQGPRILCDCEHMTGLPDPDKPPAEPDENVYKLPIKVDPATNEAYSIQFANSSAEPDAKPWGDVIGTLAEGEVEPAGSQPESTDDGSETP